MRLSITDLVKQELEKNRAEGVGLDEYSVSNLMYSVSNKLRWSSMNLAIMGEDEESYSEELAANVLQVVAYLITEEILNHDEIPF